MEKMILEIQADNPLLDKPIDVIKIAMTEFYRNYKSKKTLINSISASQGTATRFWSKRKKKTQATTQVLTQKEIDRLSYVS